MGQAVAVVGFRGYRDSVAAALDAVGAAAVLGRQRRVLIKPNLVNAAPPPVTLPVACAEAVVRYVRDCSAAEVLVGEGPGQVGLSGLDALHVHGYGALARRYAVTLVDLDAAELKRLENPLCSVFPELWLPRVVLESFVVSVPVLKAHSLAGVTLSMKNMLGCAPAAHYRRGDAWNKAAFHARMGVSVFELNRYRKPDLALVDASVGLAEFHLGGPTCDPPVNRILAGFDPVAVDAAGATLLGIDWRRVEHIRLADGVLGTAPQGVRAVGG
ncbi:MAG TPA: DUF362 domain-containing protein [Deferrisomatales bacterium]|nr:DUF362 domain-containing protein [Deferrisomatales bacterium]